MIEPYFKRALSGRWVYATVAVDLVRDIGPTEDPVAEEKGVPAKTTEENWVFARGRLRAHLAPEASSVAGPTPQNKISKGQWIPMLAGTLYKTYGPGMGVAPGRIELRISHGWDGVTTTTMNFSNGYFMTMDDALSVYPPRQYLCLVGPPPYGNNADHALVTLFEGLLRFIRHERPGPEGGWSV